MGCGEFRILCGDAIEEMNGMEPDSVDLTFFSPPYEDSRTYGIDFNVKGQEWVDWMVEVFTAARRVTKGLVVCVCEGKTRKFRYSATPVLLMADLHRAGFHLRKPPAYKRVGIPGSGGPDWLRNDWEFVVCTTRGGKLPWSDNTACGHPPKYGPGGEPSHRLADGTRVNGGKVQTRRKASGERLRDGIYKPPKLANPGNVIECHGGGGHLGSPLAHENEAPFPLKLAEFFVKSYCRPGGTVLDPFVGSGTTLHAAKLHGRNGIGIDLRESQVELTQRRLECLWMNC